MKIVLDTNVLVSALFHPLGAPARVLDLVLARQVALALDHRIFTEYQDVLHRPEFGFPGARVGEVLDFLWRAAERVQAPDLRIDVPDPADVMFIEVAVAAGADALVTGNTKHFPPRQRHEVNVLSPRAFLTFWAAKES